MCSGGPLHLWGNSTAAYPWLQLAPTSTLTLHCCQVNMLPSLQHAVEARMSLTHSFAAVTSTGVLQLRHSTMLHACNGV